MITELVTLVKDKEAKKMILVFALIGGGLIAFKSYYDMKLTKLRIKELEQSIK